MSTGHSLADLFVIEQRTQLTALITDLSTLNTTPPSAELLSRMFRAAHSLKGAARLVNNQGVEEVSHALEEELKALIAGTEVSRAQLEALVALIESLGGKTELAAKFAVEHPTPSSAESDLLHISSSHAAEMIHLASELAVITKRLDSATALGSVDAKTSDIGAISIELQRAAALAQSLKHLCYRLRLTPFAEAARSFPTVVTSIAESLGKDVAIRVVNAATLIDRDMLRQIEPCFIQLLKNSIDHGIEAPAVRLAAGKPKQGAITVTARQLGTTVEFLFTDDGAGIDLQSLREAVVARGHHDRATAAALSEEELLEFLFLPGFSTKEQVTHLSGRGIGLDIVRATLKSLGGDAVVRSAHSTGTTFLLRIPSRIASFRALLFRCGSTTVGVPLSFVERIVSESDATLHEISGKAYVEMEQQQIPLVDGSTALRLPKSPSTGQKERAVVVLGASGKRLALAVDQLLGEQEVVIQPLDRRFESVTTILGVASIGDASIVTILSPEALLQESVERLSRPLAANSSTVRQAKRRTVLVVDDSLTVRELQRRLLTQAGMGCEIAVDGVDGFEKAMSGEYDLIITDIDMPRMNGFELIERLLQQPSHQNTPILVVSYKEREAERSKSLLLGAKGFLSKGSFRDDTFIQTVQQLIGMERT